MIHCCSERSEFDSPVGTKVIDDPEPQSLSTILVEHELTSDALFATGTLGGEMFNTFFSKYEMRLSLEHSDDRAQQRIAGKTAVSPLAQFCKQQVCC